MSGDHPWMNRNWETSSLCGRSFLSLYFTKFSNTLMMSLITVMHMWFVGWSMSTFLGDADIISWFEWCWDFPIVEYSLEDVNDWSFLGLQMWDGQFLFLSCWLLCLCWGCKGQASNFQWCPQYQVYYNAVNNYIVKPYRHIIVVTKIVTWITIKT